MITRSSLTLLLLGAIAVGFAGDARADKLCVPQAIGVPGKPGAPQWTQFDNPAVGDVNPDMTDARWLGASGQTIRSGSSTPPLDFRSIYTSDGKYIELSWQVNVAAFGAAHNLYVGFMAPGDTSSAYMIRFHLPATDTGNQQFWQCYGYDDACAAQCTDGSSSPTCAPKTAWYEIYHYTSACDQTPGPTRCDCSFDYPGFTNAAVMEAVDIAPEWLAKPNSGVASTTTWMPSAIYSVAGGVWTMRVRVPIDSSPGSLTDLTKGVRLGTQFWYEAPLDVTGTAASSHQQWPRLDAHGACFPDADPSRVEIPSPLTFGDVALDPTTYYPGFSPITDLPAGCAGVSVSSQDIKVIGPDGMPGNSIYGDVTVSGSTTRFDNSFQATVHNDSTTPIDQRSLTARFRIADWGSQITPWGKEPDYPTGVWDDVPVTSGTNPVVSSGAIPAGTSATLTANWKLTDPQMTKYGLGGTGAGQVYDRHECVLVELGGASGPDSGGNIDFSQRSAFTNMEFGTMSTFEQWAKISASPKFGDKDIYLVVMPKNMETGPNHPNNGFDQVAVNVQLEEQELAGAYGNFTYGGVMYGGEPSTQMTKELPGGSPLLERWYELVALEQVRRGVAGEKLRKVDQLVAALRAGVSIPTLSEILPSVDVYVYVDTGETYSSGHKTHHVLEPMSSFGYELWHEGAVQDYLQLIDNADKIARNVYRVHTDKNGNAIVKVVSQAIAPGETPVGQVQQVCGGCCNPKCPTNVGLAESAPPLFAGVFAFRRRKRRKS